MLLHIQMNLLVREMAITRCGVSFWILLSLCVNHQKLLKKNQALRSSKKDS